MAPKENLEFGTRNNRGDMAINKQEPKAKRRVVIGMVEVREYELDLCDNPSCSLGPAVGLGWDYQIATVEPIDEYEKNRIPIRPKEELKMDRKLREEIILKSTYTNKEIKMYTLEKARIANGRTSTKANLPFAKYEEKLENVKRKLCCGENVDKELSKLWPHYDGSFSSSDYKTNDDKLNTSLLGTRTGSINKRQPGGEKLAPCLRTAT